MEDPAVLSSWDLTLVVTLLDLNLLKGTVIILTSTEN